MAARLCAADLRNDALAIAIGTVAYVVFAVWLHPWPDRRSGHPPDGPRA